MLAAAINLALLNVISTACAEGNLVRPWVIRFTDGEGQYKTGTNSLRSLRVRQTIPLGAVFQTGSNQYADFRIQPYASFEDDRELIRHYRPRRFTAVRVYANAEVFFSVGSNNSTTAPTKTSTRSRSRSVQVNLILGAVYVLAVSNSVEPQLTVEFPGGSARSERGMYTVTDTGIIDVVTGSVSVSTTNHPGMFSVPEQHEFNAVTGQLSVCDYPHFVSDAFPQDIEPPTFPLRLPHRAF